MWNKRFRAMLRSGVGYLVGGQAMKNKRLHREKRRCLWAACAFAF